jgi:hypothetical protein
MRQVLARGSLMISADMVSTPSTLRFLHRRLLLLLLRRP